MVATASATPRGVALVTGGGSGIGRAVALALLRDGYAVTLVGRRAERLQETQDLAGEHASQSLAVAANIGVPAEVERAFGQAAERFGRLDVLFNNAGSGAPPVALEDVSYEQWQRVVEVNLTGAFLCTQQAFRLMKRQQPPGGRIINNGSISAHVPRPNSAPYTATKHAVTGLTKATALDGRAHRICCGQIDIGNAATDMTARMANGVPQPDGSVRPEPTMHVQAVVDAVRYMVDLPLDTNAPFLTVMANEMPFMGRG